MLTELLRREKAANTKPDRDIDAFMKASALGGQEANVVTDYILKILGLEVCADTVVGNQLIRGISGGQRKRLTTGEMLVGPARAFFMDEISSGLDSSTTYQIVNSLRQSIHVLGGTAIISLLQPAPETYNLFDDIILLSEGQVVYQGPREDVLKFFESMGFRCPERKGVADFLQEVTSRKDQHQYWARCGEPHVFVPAKEFAMAFKSFRTGRAIAKAIGVPLDKSKNHPAALTTTRYGIRSMELLKANIDREILLMRRNSSVYVFRIFQLILMSVITMTVFFHTKMKRESITSGSMYMGAIFFGLIMVMYNGFSDLALTVSKLPIFFKQRDLLFYPAWTYTIPSWVLNVPITFVEVGSYVFIAYYAIGFDPYIGRFLKQFLLMLGFHQMVASFYRFVGGASQNMIVGFVFASSLIMVAIVFSGFVLTRDKVKKWCIWGYWFSPLMYAQNAILVNEMLGHSWDKILNSAVSNETLGVQVLKSHGVFPKAKWYWIGFGALLGFTMLFNTLFTLALSYLRPYANPQPLLNEKEAKENHSNMRNEIVDAIHLNNNLPPKINTEIELEMLEDDCAPNQKGMVLPFVPLSLCFENITYSVDMPAEMKAQGVADDRLVLLKDVNGSFRPGVLTSLIWVLVVQERLR